MFAISFRFDLIYLMLDKPNEQTDRKLARFLVGLHYEEPEVYQRAIQMFSSVVYLPTFPFFRCELRPSLTL